VTTDVATTRAAERAPERSVPTPTGLVRAHLVIAAVFLVVAVALLAVAAIEAAIPGTFSGIAPLSFGRVVPAATAALAYGWLTIAIIGASYHVLPRLTGRPLVGGGVATVALVGLTLGAAAGVGAIAFGMSEGRFFQEMPWWADLILLVAFALVAWVTTRNAGLGRANLAPSAWYLVGATWWLTLLGVIAVLPGVGGYAGMIEGVFFRAGFLGPWLTAGAVGIAYFLVPKVVGGDPLEPTPLAAIGFWSLMLVWAATGPAQLVYGAGPDWLETLGVAASIGLVVPVTVIVSDIALQIRGRPRDGGDRTALRVLLAGTALFALVPFANLLLASRTSSAVLQFTTWVPAVDVLLLMGALTLWVVAFTVHLMGADISGARRWVAVWHLRYSLLGLGLTLSGLWTGGILAGFTWAGGANSGLFAAVGDGFAHTGARLQPYLAVAAVGVVVYALAQLLVVIIVLGPARSGPEPPPSGAEVDLELEGSVRTISWSGLRYGVVGVFLVTALIMWVLPSLDPANAAATILADEHRTYPAGSAVAAGRAVYVREGCAACHTQEVRAAVPDVGLGAVSVAGDYVHENPIQRGSIRLGPDLMHIGSRPGSDYQTLYLHLVDPRATRSWSSMPSYAYLGSHDLDVLVRYLLSLK